VAQAQHQRLKRKQELITLNSILNDHNSKFTHFVEKILFKNLKGEPELMASILRETQAKWQKLEPENEEIQNLAFCKKSANLKDILKKAFLVPVQN